MIRRTLASTLVITILWTTTWVAAPVFAQQTPADEVSREEMLKRLDKFMNLIEELRSHIDRSQFDLEALLEKLDYEPDEIIRFVKSEICYQQYPGLLRGATGTLISAAGNALDQSVLLARLLKDAGVEARVVGGFLEPADSKRLTSTMSRCHENDQGIGATQEMESVLRKSASSFLDDASQLEDVLRQLEATPNNSNPSERSDAQARFLEQTLESSGAWPLNTNVLHDLAVESAEYHWVQFRKSTGAIWGDVHPVYEGDQKPENEPDPGQFFVEEIPAEQAHQIGLRVMVDRRVGTKSNRVELVGQWLRPAANLIGVPVSFTFATPGGAERLTAEPKQECGESRIFVPLINGQPQANALDLQGNVVPAAEATSFFAGLFQTVSGKFNIAGGALSGLGQPETNDSETNREPLQRLEGVIIEITLIAPGGTTRQFTRYLAPDENDRLSSDKCGDERAIWERLLGRQYTVGVSVGRFSAAYVLDHQLASLQAKESLLELMLHYSRGERPEWDLVRQLASQIEPGWIHHPLLFSVFDSREAINDEVFSYRHEPSIVIHRAGMGENSVVQAIDVVTNRRRAFRRVGSATTWAPDAALANGVWETLAEGWFLDEGGETKVSAFESLERAYAEKSKLAVFKGGASEPLDGYGFTEWTKAVLRERLQRGEILVVPTQNSKTRPESFAFWSIDPETGTAIGVGATGEGVTAAEYRIVVGASAFLGALTGCLAGGGDVFDCFALAGILGGITYGALPLLPLVIVMGEAFGAWPVTLSFIGALLLFLKNL